ncbi:hypothetical protein [Acaryochloris marina]|uniref:hypothetical protein n=1 Tax=Acaryochloris marina TaxID=155978 RepID=UPI0021C3551A|nr:hypothetical protein [Acaryochloris marina]
MTLSHGRTIRLSQLFQSGQTTLAENPWPNQAVTLADSLKPSHCSLSFSWRYRRSHATAQSHNGISRPGRGIANKNSLFELLMRDDIASKVTLVGNAGAGKTLTTESQQDCHMELRMRTTTVAC